MNLYLHNLNMETAKSDEMIYSELPYQYSLVYLAFLHIICSIAPRRITSNPVIIPPEFLHQIIRALLQRCLVQSTLTFASPAKLQSVVLIVYVPSPDELLSSEAGSVVIAHQASKELVHGRFKDREVDGHASMLEPVIFVKTTTGKTEAERGNGVDLADDHVKDLGREIGEVCFSFPRARLPDCI